MIASPQDYLQAAQQIVETENRLRNQAQQLFDVANEMRKRQTDESLPFEERYWATILIEEANELAKDHLDVVDWLLKRKGPLTPEGAGFTRKASPRPSRHGAWCRQCE